MRGSSLILIPVLLLCALYGKAQPDTLFAFRLNSLNTELNVDFNAQVKKYLQPLLKNENDSTSKALALYAHHQAYFDSVFSFYGVPMELSYAFLTFSGGYYSYRHPSGRSGPWMMDYNAARSMGLRISSFIDERRDPRISASAFAQYMAQINRIYNDWNLSYAAYLSSVTEVNDAIRNAKGKTDFKSLAPSLTREANESADRLSALIYIGHFFKNHGISLRHPYVGISTMDTLLHKWVNLRQWADSASMDMTLMRFLNPIYFRGTIPLEKRALALTWPNDKAYLLPFLDSLVYSPYGMGAGRATNQNITGGPAESGTFIRHKVKSGETISGIARRYDCSVSDIKRWNRLKSGTLRSGQVLRIQRNISTPEPSSAKPSETKTPSDTIQKAPPSTKPAPPASNDIIYIVKSGDNLGKIAAKYGVTVQQLKDWNNLRSDNISIGQRLKIRK